MRQSAQRSSHTLTEPAMAQMGRNRLVPVMHLVSGEAVTLFAEPEKRFEERAVFGPAGRAAECSAPALPSDWLAAQLEQIAIAAHARTTERPVIVPMSLAALIHADTPLACEAAILRTRLCPQEICLEVDDAALALPTRTTQSAIEKLRSKGFRVSLNATRSWRTALSAPLRLLLDNLRIDARRLSEEPELGTRVEAAACCGMAVIAEHASWRDGDRLAEIGIEYAIRPRADC